MVRRPAVRSASARASASRRSFRPAMTADIGTKFALVWEAMILASVVLPDPGGPHSTMEPRSSRRIALWRGEDGPTTLSCPAISSSEAGRIRSASGALPDSNSPLSLAMMRSSKEKRRPVGRLDSFVKCGRIRTALRCPHLPLKCLQKSPRSERRWLRRCRSCPTSGAHWRWSGQEPVRRLC